MELKSINPTGSVFSKFKKGFLGNIPNSLNAFDEPTYLSFKIRFLFDDRNNAKSDNYAGVSASYDSMPHPLLMDYAPYSADKQMGKYSAYSTMSYLVETNETIRASLLEEFREKLNNIQNNYQWYFQSIDNLGDLLNINTKRGFRVPEDFRLSIKCLEGLDLRMSYLMSLYRRIAWDDTWQRWMLPDMMRYFKMRIYVTEFRTFHEAFNNISPNRFNIIGEGKERLSSLYSLNLGENYNQSYKGMDEIQLKKMEIDDMALSIINYYMPSICIDCEQCEFDIDSNPYTYLSGTNNIGESKLAETEFKIKVGKVKVLQHFPQFKHEFLDDYILNKSGGRYIEENSADSKSVSENHTIQGSNRNSFIPLETKIMDGEDNAAVHIVGETFLTAYDNINGAFNISKELMIDEEKEPDPTNQSTWLGNAANTGKAYLKNTVNSLVDKAKMTNIPGLGVSYNEAQLALSGKDVFSIFGMVKKAFDNVKDNGPSSALTSEIVDNTFKQVVRSIAQSEATNETEIEMQNAANMILNDSGKWDKILDYSLATNMIGEGEKNITNNIQSPNSYKSAIDKQINNDYSLATDLKGKNERNTPLKTENLNSYKDNTKTDKSLATSITIDNNKMIIIEGIPSSSATQNKIQK